ncbi:L,D-transpeptidase family protein [Bifidobacterium xylocopae]|uniref:Peptidoglycan-binding protein n=1 Tax=Bifidobacterium xylocopae TaxID=2493119 RepID=A0A366KEW2_9BIFI|nr:L,D-transpeptidase family protein [Bifidobacterium xylocopae]RBP99211.1 peptidoglycan-binding protein [Bifidobacterium xylocopae]
MVNDVHGNARIPSYDATDAHRGADAYAGAENLGERTMSMPPLTGAAFPAPAIPVGAYPQSLTGADQTQVIGVPGADATMALPAFGPSAQSTVPSQVTMDGSDMPPVDGIGSHADAGSKRPRFWLIVVLCVLAALIVAMVAGFFGARSYYAHRAAPGVRFGGESVAGKDAGQLKDLVAAKASGSQLVVTDGKGGHAHANLKELGVTSNVDKTVEAILSAKSSNQLARVNPFQRQTVPLAYRVDEVKMNDFLTRNFVDKDQRAQPSIIVFDGGSKTFAVQGGRDGRAPDLAPVKRALERTAQEPGGKETVTTGYRDVKTPVTQDVAAKAADEANQRLSTPMVVDNGAGDKFTVPTEQVAQWIKPTADLRRGTLELEYDQDAIKAYAAKELPAKLNKDMVTEKNVKNTKGEVVAVTEKGQDGVKLKDTDATAAQILGLLQSGRIAPIKAAADVEQHKEETRTARYDVPDGDMWVEVNLSTQTATAYKGTTMVKSFPICSGLPRNGDESDPGTFFINIRYDVQTMRGPGYVSPNVRWVSYYNGSEGFHTALWNYDAIAHGDAANRGSHGCINMYEQDAKWIYDNCPKGTMVKVIGAQPTAPVR